MPADLAPIVRADRDGGDRQTVARVDQHRVRRHAQRVLLAPLPERDHRRQQVAALFGQPVLDLAAVLFARDPFEHAVLDQPREPVREDVAGDAELARELLEMNETVERGPQDQERPAFAHHFQCLRKAARGGRFQVLSQLAHAHPLTEISGESTGRANLHCDSQLNCYTYRSATDNDVWKRPDMRRFPLQLALALGTLAAAPVLAQAPTMRAEIAAATDSEREVIVDGRLWNCSGSVCTTRGDDPRPAVACRKLARKAGPVVRFVTSQGELDAAGLAACNQDHE